MYNTVLSLTMCLESESESETILFDHNTCTLVILKVIDILNIEVNDDFC